MPQMKPMMWVLLFIYLLMNMGGYLIKVHYFNLNVKPFKIIKFCYLPWRWKPKW